MWRKVGRLRSGRQGVTLALIRTLTLALSRSTGAGGGGT